MKLYLKSFWKVLPMLFTKDFWFTNKMVKKRRFGCLYTFDNVYEIKKWAKRKGYSWDSTWYLNGERYLYKDGVPVCMIQPYNPKILTRYFAHQPDYTDELVEDKTFLLNRSKTAKALFECLNKEREYLYERDMLCEKITKNLKNKEYINSNDFLTDLAHLSFGNYYDILELRNDSIYSNKEKQQFIGDYCDFDKIKITSYLSCSEAEEKELNGEDFDWNWTADFVPTALTEGAIDSVLCINPHKIPGLTVTPELLKRMHDLFFNGI